MVVDFLKIFSGTRVCGAQSRKVHCMGQAARRAREKCLFFGLARGHLSQTWIAGFTVTSLTRYRRLADKGVSLDVVSLVMTKNRG